MKSHSELIVKLQQSIDGCMIADRHRLRMRLKEIEFLHSKNSSIEQEKASRLIDQLVEKMASSSAKMSARKNALPTPRYELDLPVTARKDEIKNAIGQHQVVIVCGETGSGKTTQLPKICLELGRGVSGFIGHTQPRRIAARSVASRIAQELDSPLGALVGYKVRFTDKTDDSGYIKLMTDGILLSETQYDRYLNQYDTIIIDEAHERSLNIDFLLGYLKQLLPKRPDLKVIVTSATIDADRFSKHFNDAPIIEVSGRTYPVEVRYRPLGGPSYLASNQEEDFEDEETILPGIKRKGKTEARWIEEDDSEEAIEQAILQAAEELLREGDGDILVFLPGEREIRDTMDYIRKHQAKSPKLKHSEILPLFARLSVDEQQKIFKPSSTRRLILSTNVAETSLTVPGIKYVIDTGLARINRYSPRAKVEQLQVEKISQAAAKQRSGRCGRVSNGICIRLYEEADFNARAAFTDPEILRSSLASVILRMAALGLGEVQHFPFIDPPHSRLIADGYQLLHELGAVNAQHQITELGRSLARLPLDPRLGRMILSGKQEGVLREILIIVSALSIQDPRERPLEKREAADQAHAKYAHERSDFLSYLKLWDFFEDALKHKKSNRDLLQKCHQNFLSFIRLKEWRDLHSQIREIAEELELKSSVSTLELDRLYDPIHRALLAGLLGNIGFKDGEAESYLGARGIRFAIAPGSVIKKAKPKWVMAADLVETTKLYARCVAAINPDWIEPLARDLTQSHFTDPRWDRKSAQVMAWERVSLYGLTVIPKRKVHYGSINPAESREIFIREALANMEFDTKASFFEANRSLIAQIQELEHKARRQDVLVDEQTLFSFYDQIIPQGIYNGAAFEKWRKEIEQSIPRILFLTKDTLMRHGAAGVTEVQFPEQMDLDGISLPLKYRFEPGHVLDGVTATVPLPVLNQLDPVSTEWLVPGMIREKVTALIKSLPKAFRRVCVPVPHFVTDFLEIADHQKPLLPHLAHFISEKTGLKLSPQDFSIESLDQHLRMNFRIVDEKQHELAMGRDWNELKIRLGSVAQLTFRNQSPDVEKSGIRQWDFGDITQKINFIKQGHPMVGFSAIVDEKDAVAIRLFDTELEAIKAHRKGVARLMRFELKEQVKQLEKGLPQFNQYALLLRNLISADALREEVMLAIADRAFIGEDELPYDNQSFMQLKQRARARLPAVVESITKQLLLIANEYQLLTQTLASSATSVSKIKRELEIQISQLLPVHFLTQTPWAQLQHLPRYLKAMRLRIDKYPNQRDRDERHAQMILGIWQRWEAKLKQLRQAHQPIKPEIEAYRWLIEELKVSLFAQELKTPFPVSAKRLDKIWQDLDH
jgi:ATP-dependent helicase HrpA